MNIAIEYPQNFPLSRVDRDIYTKRLLAVLNDPRRARMSALDDLREWAGLPPIWSHGQRDVLETLLSLMTAGNREEYRDSLIDKTAAYLGIVIRQVPETADAATEAEGAADVVPPPDDPQPVTPPSHRRHWIDRALPWCVVVLTGVCLALAWVALSAHGHADGTVSAGVRARSAVPMPYTDVGGETRDASALLSPLVDLKVDTREPARAFASLAKLAPAASGEYLIELRISPVFDGPIEVAAATGRATQRGNTVHGAKQ